jgi:glutathione peroxidase
MRSARELPAPHRHRPARVIDVRCVTARVEHASSVHFLEVAIMSGFYDISVQSIDGSADLLSKLRGKVALAVNVASRCGLTPQYDGLEKLQRELQDQNFTVIGFPCNQFGAQEPGTEQQIVQFCQTTFDVTFPMSSKLEVNGSNRHPLYTFLTSPDTGVSGDITWNFEKFLIGRDGKVLKRYPPQTKPQDSGIMQDIADAL